jgi:hypothetical protein
MKVVVSLYDRDILLLAVSIAGLALIVATIWLLLPSRELLREDEEDDNDDERIKEEEKRHKMNKTQRKEDLRRLKQLEASKRQQVSENPKTLRLNNLSLHEYEGKYSPNQEQAMVAFLKSIKV